MDIVKTYRIAAPLPAVWRALTDPDVIEEWGGGPALMEPEAGAVFSLWGGDIHGTVTEAVPERRLVQAWYGGAWPAPSTVVFELSAEGGGTSLTLTHTGVPDEDVADIDAGWDEYYLGPMQELLEAADA